MTPRPISASLGSSARPAATPSRTGATPSDERVGQRAPGQQVQRVLLGQLGERRAELLERGRPPAAGPGSTEKSIRRAASAGSVTRKVTVSCTNTSWKSLVRARNSSGSSRSSTGTSLIAADSGRNQNASAGAVVPRPPVAQVQDVGRRRAAQVPEKGEGVMSDICLTS